MTFDDFLEKKFDMTFSMKNFDMLYYHFLFFHEIFDILQYDFSCHGMTLYSILRLFSTFFHGDPNLDQKTCA